jgi:uncharacterized protein YndB with AHSA1/START domain
MAAPIVLSAPINASSEAIYKALTESAGLAGFWVEDSHAESVVGSVSRLRAPSGDLELQVDRLEPGRAVVWIPRTTVARPPSWIGTTVSWQLTEWTAGTTEVLIQHAGWPDEMRQADLAQLTFLWSGVLRSLKAFVESGTPRPIIRASKVAS